ncbi:CheR family methyltransferase [Fuscovulum ytuae]|uniref:Chemotaxis protein methyltransferase n=1 Tax=Fuscovulum ytuae TaxID=3042299 RepID=A0ABY8Q546_9RHOB|nr:protein-glutamate O-methyltransferase CheR [Fuscovulum sp. YMD61]WGV15799.1 protein-glutamate O-methyltransferase CheR [Fuscovulum sp. YMD61]
MPQTVAPGRPDNEIDAETFARLQRIVERETGIALAEGKRPMLQARLATRLRSLGMAGFQEFLTRVEGPDAATERASLISAITTNVTSFFREAHHFTLLQDRILPPLLDQPRNGARLRLWSSACSSGEEAYSIAAILLAAVPDANRRDARILATDIDEQVLNRAITGDYGPQQMAGLSPVQRGLLFGPTGSTQIRSELRQLVGFRQLNLNGDWPMRGPFDVIFCRNVAIYFPRERQERLWQRFADLLAPGGWLLLGHSERLSGPATAAFRCEDITAYRKIG